MLIPIRMMLLDAGAQDGGYLRPRKFIVNVGSMMTR